MAEVEDILHSKCHPPHGEESECGIIYDTARTETASRGLICRAAGEIFFADCYLVLQTITSLHLNVNFTAF